MPKDRYENAVKTADGEVENFILRVAGKPFRCKCGCNVFHKPNAAEPELYQCNACDQTFEAE